MSYIRSLIIDVEKTHKNFGNLIAMIQIGIKARKFMLIISPSGCGKSRAIKFMAKNTPNSYMPDSISIANLGAREDYFTSFRSVIACEDISKIQGDYGKRTTLSTLSSLCYDHRVQPSMHGFDFTIEDFYGAALMGIQPKMLHNLMLEDEWETHIQDKTIRYYHLFRPLLPTLHDPEIIIKKGIDFDAVKDFEPKNNPNWNNLLKIGDTQWSVARCKEHLIDFLKAIAALENRNEVIDDDYILLRELMKPMAIESIVVVKEDLEGEALLDNNLLALLVEYYTYNGEFFLAQVAKDFKGIGIKQAYKIMNTQNGNWQQISKSPTAFIPSKKLLKELKKIGMEIKND